MASPPNSGRDPSGPASDRLAYRPNPGTLDRALALVRFLRRHCDWDAEQTPASLVRHLLEEAHETAAAIRGGNAGALCRELGDLLLNLAFQIVIAEETDAFDAEDVAAGLERKMVRRHPHLFSGGPAASWEEIRRRERGDGPLLDGVMDGLDPVVAAHRIQERVAGVGFDWDDPRPALVKLREEAGELEHSLAGGREEEVEAEVGDLLFSVVNVARLCGVHAADALDAANRKFTRRFTRLEALAHERERDFEALDLPAMDALWDEVKSEEG